MTTHRDRRDTPGDFDIVSVEVTHRRSGMVYEIRTARPWPTSSLRLDRDRYFVIGIDADGEARDRSTFERCAFVFYSSRLTGVLSNCGRQRLGGFGVRRLGGTGLRVALDFQDVSWTHRWAVFSIDGDGPCPRPCSDAVPNRTPLPLHDLEAPRVLLVTPVVEGLTTDFSATTSIDIPLRVIEESDGSGIDHWGVETRPLGGSDSDWSLADTGTGDGRQTATIVVPEGARIQYRAWAVDRQGNVEYDTTARADLQAPRDDDDARATTVGGSVVSDPAAFQGGYRSLAPGDSVSVTASTSPLYFLWIGDGSGSWIAEVEIYDQHGSLLRSSTVTAASAPDGPRKLVYYYYENSYQPPVTFKIVAVEGAVPVDAFVVDL